MRKLDSHYFERIASLEKELKEALFLSKVREDALESCRKAVDLMPSEMRAVFFEKFQEAAGVRKIIVGAEQGAAAIAALAEV